MYLHQIRDAESKNHQKNAHRGCFLKAISDRVHQKVNPVLPPLDLPSCSMQSVMYCVTFPFFQTRTLTLSFLQMPSVMYCVTFSLSLQADMYSDPFLLSDMYSDLFLPFPSCRYCQACTVRYVSWMTSPAP